MDLKKQLRGKINDYAISAHLINLSETRKSNEKEEKVEEMYKNLENWIFKNIKNDTLEKNQIEDTTIELGLQESSMDF